MGIKHTNKTKWVKLSNDQIEFICELYFIGLTTGEIAKEVGISEYYVVRTLVKKGLIRDY